MWLSRILCRRTCWGEGDAKNWTPWKFHGHPIQNAYDSGWGVQSSCSGAYYPRKSIAFLGGCKRWLWVANFGALFDLRKLERWWKLLETLHWFNAWRQIFLSLGRSRNPRNLRLQFDPACPRIQTGALRGMDINGSCHGQVPGRFQTFFDAALNFLQILRPGLHTVFRLGPTIHRNDPHGRQLQPQRRHNSARDSTQKHAFDCRPQQPVLHQNEIHERLHYLFRRRVLRGW